MKVKRTEGIELDKTFDVDCAVTKAWKRPDGKRVVRGVASGIAEDKDGERVSKNAVNDMARQAVAGMKLTTKHEDRDWADEIGDIEKVEHDVDHDELLVEAVLPEEGDDPLADKAWTRMTKHGEKLGFSIGGKLRKAYFELSPVGKRRKVLDSIALNHFVLTKKPSYAASFAEAVAKTADLDKLQDALEVHDFTAEVEAEQPEAFVAKRGETDQDQGGAERNAGDGGDGPPPSKDVNGDDDEDEPEQPEEKAIGRHLACPNCGHEFAADLPAEQDAPADAGGEDTNDRDAAKTAPEGSTMDLKKTVEELRGLVSDTPAEPEPKVEKTDDADQVTAVEKMVAASHEKNGDAIAAVAKTVDELTAKVGDSFERVVDAFQHLAGQPAGRQSVARRGPEQGATPPGEVRKTTGEEPEDETVEEAVAKTDNPLDALKAVNKTAYGIE